MKIGTRLSVRLTENCKSYHAENWVPTFVGMTNMGECTEDSEQSICNTYSHTPHSKTFVGMTNIGVCTQDYERNICNTYSHTPNSKTFVISMKIGTKPSVRPTEKCENHHAENWVPAFAGMTEKGGVYGGLVDRASAPYIFHLLKLRT